MLALTLRYRCQNHTRPPQGCPVQDGSCCPDDWYCYYYNYDYDDRDNYH